MQSGPMAGACPCGRSQLFVSVSDTMFNEFVPPYYQPYYARYGIAQFGCCDPLHNRIEAIRTIPNVRKISMSPWAYCAGVSPKSLAVLSCDLDRVITRFPEQAELIRAFDLARDDPTIGVVKSGSGVRL